MPPTEEPSSSRFAFMNPANNGNSPRVSLSDSGTKHRLMVVGGGAAGLLILFLLFYGLVLSHKPSAKNLVTLAQEQTELIQISNTAEQQAAQQATKNLAVNASLTLTTGQSQLLNYLKKHGQKVTNKQLALGISASVTGQLRAAISASNFDSVYFQVMQSLLTQYSQTLSTNLKSSSSKTETQLLTYETVIATDLQNQASSSSSISAGT